MQHENCLSVEKEKKNIQLIDCLKLFLQMETLSPDDAW